MLQYNAQETKAAIDIENKRITLVLELTLLFLYILN